MSGHTGNWNGYRHQHSAKPCQKRSRNPLLQRQKRDSVAVERDRNLRRRSDRRRRRPSGHVGTGVDGQQAGGREGPKRGRIKQNSSRRSWPVVIP